MNDHSVQCVIESKNSETTESSQQLHEMSTGQLGDPLQMSRERVSGISLDSKLSPQL